ncbi:17-beta-hydroxysteroid dehydrogenase type 3-like isoform X2 [Phyllobates terribilis]|uniref:17-beta-hydroxysteroid dehydrogenase type 3-like isoform X2 n=1 Tax=Phyllobates terribilis TaxID=111132 RepID=UPI003CCB434E
MRGGPCPAHPSLSLLSVLSGSMAGEESCLCTQGFALFGILAAAYIVISQTWKVIRGLRSHILSQWWRTDLTQYGRWAVVTGATDGIGKAYALELAKRGLDVVLISRTLEKLKRVAAEIEKESGRKIKYIQADFTNGSNIYHMIQEELKSLEIGVLVNNVGMKISESATKFLDAPNLEKMLENTINCNILSAVQVFVDFFSRGLHTEYKSKGITVQCVMPLLVSTEMTYKMKTNIFVKSADDFAHEALNTVGYTERTSGCMSHSLQSYALHLLPDKLLYLLLQSELMKKQFNDISRSKNKEN